MKLVIASADLVSGIKYAAHEVGRSKDSTLYMTVEGGAKPTITFYGNGLNSEAQARLPLFSLDTKGMIDGVMRVALDASKTLALAGLLSRADYTTITYSGAASAVPHIEQDSGLKVRMAVHAAAMGNSPISGRMKTTLKAQELTRPARAADVAALLSAADAVAYAESAGRQGAALRIADGALTCFAYGCNAMAMYINSVDIEAVSPEPVRSLSWDALTGWLRGVWRLSVTRMVVILCFLMLARSSLRSLTALRPAWWTRGVRVKWMCVSCRVCEL